MRHYFIAFFLLCTCLPAKAIYRCEQKGTVSYADEPCAGGRSTDISEDVRDAVSPGDAAAARKQLQQQKRAVANMDREKSKEREKQSKARQVSIRKAAEKEKACQSLALKKKWAEDDLASADSRSADSARRKAQRTAEQYNVSCTATRTLELF